MHYFDAAGWLSPLPIPGRSTDIAPPTDDLPEGYGWNFTGHRWVSAQLAPALPPLPPPAPEPEWAWLIDTGPFTDRLGAAAVAIDISTEPSLVAIRSDFARRKWIDLKDQRVAGAIAYLSGQRHPVLGTLAQPLLTAAQAQAILTTKPTPAENLALRKLYFNA